MLSVPLGRPEAFDPLGKEPTPKSRVESAVGLMLNKHKTVFKRVYRLLKESYPRVICVTGITVFGRKLYLSMRLSLTHGLFLLQKRPGVR